MDGKRAGRLQEVALQTIVLNFEKIFLEKLSHNDSEGRVKSDLSLPRHFFEMILEESRNMRWSILPQSLKTCLSGTRQLQWHDICLPNLHHPTSCLSRRDLRSMVTNDATPIRLSFAAATLETEDLRMLSEVGSRLERLEISSTDDESSCAQQERLRPATASFPNLRELSLDCLTVGDGNPDRINLDLCVGTLQILKVERARVTPAFLNKMKSLARLKSLSLHGSRFVDVRFSELTGALGSMGDLESLDIGRIQIDILPNDVPAMGMMMLKLEKLDSLEVVDNHIAKSILEWIPKRNFKYLGVYNTKSTLEDFMDRGRIDSLQADRISSSHRLDRLLTAIEEFVDRRILFAHSLDALNSRYSHGNFNSEHLERIENIILAGFYRYSSAEHEAVGSKFEFDTNVYHHLDLLLSAFFLCDRWTVEFIRKVANILISSCTINNMKAKWTTMYSLGWRMDEGFEFYITQFLERCLAVTELLGDASIGISVVEFLCNTIKNPLLDRSEANQIAHYLHKMLEKPEYMSAFRKKTGCNNYEDFIKGRY